MAKILTIIKNPDILLRKKSSSITEAELKLSRMKKICEDMILTMTNKDGVGLAAPQIGKNIRLIVINTKNGPLAIINPKITKKSFTKEWGEEGCLSVPGIFGQVKRHKKIKCSYLTSDAMHLELEASGLMARVIQHEIDHLDGVLFIDKAKDIVKADEKPKSKK